MRGPVTQFLLVAMLTATPCSNLSAQDTGKPGKADRLEKAVQNYEDRLSQLEAVLNKKLGVGGKAAAKASQDRLKSAEQEMVGAARRQQKELARVQKLITTLRESLAEAGSKNLKLAASLNSRQRELADLKQRQAGLLDQKKREGASSTTAARQAEQTRQSLAQAKQQSEDLTRQLSAEPKEHAGLRESHARLLDQTEKSKAVMAESPDQVNRLREEMDAARSHGKQLEEKLAAQQALTQSALQTQASAKARLNTQATAIDRAHQGLARARQQTTILEDLLAATRNKLSNAEQDLDARLSKAETALSKATVLIAENRRLAGLLAQTTKRETDLADRLEALRAELTTAQSANDTLRKALEHVVAPPSPPTRGQAAKGVGEGIRIYNAGGTIIIHQAGKDSLREQTRDSSRTSSDKTAPDRKTREVPPTSRSKSGSNKRRRSKTSTTIRRINI